MLTCRVLDESSARRLSDLAGYDREEVLNNVVSAGTLMIIAGNPHFDAYMWCYPLWCWVASVGSPPAASCNMDVESGLGSMEVRADGIKVVLKGPSAPGGLSSLG
jgi:hypothetical protein